MTSRQKRGKHFERRKANKKCRKIGNSLLRTVVLVMVRTRRTAAAAAGEETADVEPASAVEPPAAAEAVTAEHMAASDDSDAEEEEVEEAEDEGSGESDGEDDAELEGEELEDEEDEVDSSDVDSEEEEEEEEAAAAALVAAAADAAAEEEDGDDEAEARRGAAALGLGGSEQPESDSEDEMPLNTIGNVPLEWYDGFEHVGYDLEGRKIMRGARTDELDALIKRFDDPDANRTIHDALHGVDVVLSQEDVALIRRLQRRRYPGATFDPYPETVPFDFPDGKVHPLSSAPPRKAPFLPSKDEAKKVMRLVMAMRSEQYQRSVANRRLQEAKERPDYQQLIWDEPPEGEVRHRKRLPAPKVSLPGNAESHAVHPPLLGLAVSFSLL